MARLVLFLDTGRFHSGYEICQVNDECSALTPFSITVTQLHYNCLIGTYSRWFRLQHHLSFLVHMHQLWSVCISQLNSSLCIVKVLTRGMQAAAGKGFATLLLSCCYLVIFLGSTKFLVVGVQHFTTR